MVPQNVHLLVLAVTPSEARFGKSLGLPPNLQYLRISGLPSWLLAWLALQHENLLRVRFDGTMGEHTRQWTGLVDRVGFHSHLLPTHATELQLDALLQEGQNFALAKQVLGLNAELALVQLLRDHLEANTSRSECSFEEEQEVASLVLELVAEETMLCRQRLREEHLSRLRLQRLEGDAERALEEEPGSSSEEETEEEGEGVEEPEFGDPGE